jgi:hypothetical protein
MSSPRSLPGPAQTDWYLSGPRRIFDVSAHPSKRWRKVVLACIYRMSYQRQIPHLLMIGLSYSPFRLLFAISNELEYIWELRGCGAVASTVQAVFTTVTSLLEPAATEGCSVIEESTCFYYCFIPATVAFWHTRRATRPTTGPRRSSHSIPY